MGDISEKNLETMIFKNRHTIHERGFIKFYANTERQFRLPNGLIIDIFTYEVIDDVLFFKIIELKVTAMTPDAIFQLIRYFSFLHVYTQDQFKNVKWELILVGCDHTEHSLDIMGLGIKISFYEFEFGFNGLFFKREPCEELDFNDGKFGEFSSEEIVNSIKSFSSELK